MTESVFLIAIAIALVAYALHGTRIYGAAHDLILYYWKLVVGLILLVLVVRIWVAASQRSVLVMPFDITTPCLVAGITGISLSRMVFDEIQTSSQERQDTVSVIGKKPSYEPELPKSAQPAADLGAAVTLDFKGLSIDSVLNFTRRLRGTLAVITGELFTDGTGVAIRSRCSVPAFFGSGMSKPYRESTVLPAQSWKLRDAVRQIGTMIAADLRREACYELPAEDCASMLVELGKKYVDGPGDRLDNLQEAIRCYDEALLIFGKHSHPKEWGRTMNYRGNAYRLLSGPDRRANLRTAIECYEQALEVCTKTADPRAWAGTTSNLALTCQQLQAENGWHHLQRAIDYYDQALEILAMEGKGNRLDWARTSRNKAGVLAILEIPKHAQNIEQALQIYASVLKVFEDNPEEQAYTMSAIANAYRQLPSDRDDNLRTAVRYFDLALQVFNRTRYPTDWANVMTQKGNAYREMMGFDRSASLRDAISCFDQALEVFVKERYPAQWANTTNQRGVAYRELAGPDRIGNINEAISCFNSALTVLDRTRYPLEWANTQNLRGTAYQQLPGPDRPANLLEAIRSYEAALQVRTRREFPTEWAQSTTNRSTAYVQLHGPDRAANVREAISGYQEVLTVFTPSSFPEEYANTMRLLAIAYREMRVPDMAAGDAPDINSPQPEREEKRGAGEPVKSAVDTV